MLRQVQLGDRLLDLESQQVTQPDGKTVSLTQLELKLLLWMLDHVESVVSTEDLLVHVWGYAPTVKTRAVANTISRLRAKLEDDPKNPDFLLSVYGVGYRLVLPPGAITTSGLIGRGALLAEIFEAARVESLVTLHGPAGSGKTDLARQLSGALFIDLADETHPEEAVARVLGVGLQAGVPTTGALARALSARQPSIVVLDTAEHLIEALRGFLTILRTEAPDIRFLVTSRASLDLPWERVIRVSSLEKAEAVALFQKEATSVRADLELDEPTVSAIVDQLDRLPLALILAARHLGYLSPARLLATLQGRVRTGGLLDAFRWSWKLLNAEQQGVLTACSLFPAGFDLDALEQVAPHGEEPLLASLKTVERFSLLERQGGTRLAVLTSFRQFALSTCAPDVLTACKERFLALLSNSARHHALSLIDGWSFETSDAILQEEGNYRAALTMATGDDAGWLTLALICCGVIRSDSPTRCTLLDSALEAVQDPSLAAWLRIIGARRYHLAGEVQRARALLDFDTAGLSERIRLHWEFGSSPAESGAEAFYERHVHLCEAAQRIGDLALAAKCIQRTCQYLAAHGRDPEAVTAYVEAEYLAQRVGDDYGVFFARVARGGTWIRLGRLADAITLLETHWTSSDPLPTALRCDTGRLLAAALLYDGQVAAGIAISRSAIQLARSHGLIAYEATLANNLAAVSDTDEAIELLQSAKVLYRISGRHQRLAGVLMNLALRYALQKKYVEALQKVHEGLEVLNRHPDPLGKAQLIALEVGALTRVDLPRARERHADLLAAPSHLQALQTITGFSEAFLALADGRFDEALRLREELAMTTVSRFLNQLFKVLAEDHGAPPPSPNPVQ